MRNAPMTFEQFRASLVVYSWGKIPPDIMDDDIYEGESQLSYASNSSLIFHSDAGYRLHIANQEWLSFDLLSLEKILYTQWYLNEVAA
jgi:hypothetical protein